VSSQVETLWHLPAFPWHLLSEVVIVEGLDL